MASRDHFVVGGANRAREAIRLEVNAEFVERWEAASLWQRLRLRREIEREVERRAASIAPPEALF